MAQVSMSTQVNASPDEVWKRIGGFDGMPDWHPLISRSEASEGGRVRRLTLPDGGVVVARLLSFRWPTTGRRCAFVRKRGSPGRWSIGPASSSRPARPKPTWWR